MKILKYIQHNRQSQRGFTMLFSVLVSSLLLSVGISIFNLTIKELSLSAAGRESQFAFYAADTGAECALYWDLKGGERTPEPFYFATSTVTLPPGVRELSCGGQVLSVEHNTSLSQGEKDSITNLVVLPAKGITTFSFRPVASGGTPESFNCVTVQITKDVAADGAQTTKIESRGYNTGYQSGPADCDGPSPLKVERGVKFTY